MWAAGAGARAKDAAEAETGTQLRAFVRKDPAPRVWLLRCLWTGPGAQRGSVQAP